MRRLLTLPLAVAVLACAPSMTQALVVIGTGSTNINNGSLDETYPQVIFDYPDPGPPFDFLFAKPTHWINEGTRDYTGSYEDELSSQSSANGAPTPQTAYGSGLPQPDGCGSRDCGVYFKSFTGDGTHGPATGHLYQDNRATPGMKYILTAWAGAEDFFFAEGAELALEFLDTAGNVIPRTGQVINLIPTLKFPNGKPFNFQEYRATAIAPANAAEVRARVSMLRGIRSPAFGGQAFLVDDITLIGVPEPASLTLALLSVFGVLSVARRRQANLSME